MNPCYVRVESMVPFSSCSYGCMVLSYIHWSHREFEARIVILHHATTVACGYQPVIHCGVMRQSAEIFSITTDRGSFTLPDNTWVKGGKLGSNRPTTTTSAVGTAAPATPTVEPAPTSVSLRTGERELSSSLTGYIPSFLIVPYIYSGATVKFRLKYNPEYILPGSTFLFREGRAKGMLNKVL